MRAGELDRTITLRKLVESQSDSGAVILTPQTVASGVWARKAPERSLESFREEQTAGWRVVMWRTRYLLDAAGLEPTVKWQIVEGTRVYDILDVREIGRREGWEFVAQARAEAAA